MADTPTMRSQFEPMAQLVRERLADNMAAHEFNGDAMEIRSGRADHVDVVKCALIGGEAVWDALTAGRSSFEEWAQGMGFNTERDAKDGRYLFRALEIAELAFLSSSKGEAEGWRDEFDEKRGPWHCVDEKGNDNFATSIYESDYDGVLVARCNQNGSFPWQGPAIVRGLEANKRSGRPALPSSEASS